MTHELNHPSNSNEHTERCVLYLLGDMPPADVDAFEQQLSTNKELSQELARQSELVYCLSQACSANAKEAAKVQPVTVDAGFRSATNEGSSQGFYRYAGMLAVAAAACFLFVFVNTQTNNTNPGDHSDTEDLRIAQAWLSVGPAESLDSIEMDDAVVELDLENDLASDENSMTWLMAAVEAESIDG